MFSLPLIIVYASGFCNAFVWLPHFTFSKRLPKQKGPIETHSIHHASVFRILLFRNGCRNSFHVKHAPAPFRTQRMLRKFLRSHSKFSSTGVLQGFSIGNRFRQPNPEGYGRKPFCKRCVRSSVAGAGSCSCGGFTRKKRTGIHDQAAEPSRICLDSGPLA